MISIRSSNGPGTVSSILAVVIEHDPGEVERHAKIIVAKGPVLLGVEHFQHRGRRVSLDAASQLVDLVQHHDAIARAGLLDCLNDVARQRADIGAAVAADFRFIMNAAETDPHERPSHRARNRLSQRGLADAGRTDEAKNWRLAFRRQLANREVFDDPALDLLQAIVVLIEDAPCRGDIDRLLVRQAPGQFDQPVDITSDHSCFGRALRHPLVAANFPSRLTFHFSRHLGLGDGFIQFSDFLRLAVAFSELALNGRHLLSKNRLTLTDVESRLRLLSDFVAEPKHFDALGQMPRNLLHAQRKVDRLEDLLLVLRLDIHVRRREIGEHRRRGGALQDGDQFLRGLRQQFRSFDGLPLQTQEAGLDLRRTRDGLGNVENPGCRKRRARKEIEHTDALYALAHDVVAIIGPREVANDVGHGADAVKIVETRFVQLRVALKQDADLSLLAYGLLRSGDRLRPTSA